ncbi:MAG TPA: histidinol-phosphate transaminase [Rhodocyclaceae bacterium]|nr:histidinol-phosphate transaminase [Rhodocyclaceae bacterium]
MSIAEQSPSYIRAISPYVPGKPITELAREMDLDERSIVKLASNENPLGMSPKAKQAVQDAINGIERYPDNFELTHKLAERCGVNFAQIVLGNGSNDILELAARAFLAPGRSAVFSAYAFAVYPLATMGAGAECIAAPSTKDYGHDLAAMKAAIRPDTKVVWLANPNNPTGTFLPYGDIEKFIASISPDILVVLDEAYNDYLPLSERFDTLAWVKQFPNVLITRTFSKIFGLAGLRIGYGVGSQAVVDLLNRVRQPFNVNNLALVAASAALDDQAFLNESFELNACGMAQLLDGLRKLGLESLPSYGNFITFKVADAAGVNRRLLKQGVIVRPLAGYKMPDWLRVTIGREHENVRFLEALEHAIRG